MAARYHCDPKNIVVGLGPVIGSVNYRIALDKAALVAQALGAQTKSLLLDNEGAQFDITTALREQLQEAGVESVNIEAAGRDTFADPGRYFSERRDGVPTGRFCAGIWLS